VGRLRIGIVLVSVGVWLILVPHVSSAASRITAPASSWLAGWPMAGHDPQRTYRSPETAPTDPHLLLTRKNLGVRIIGPNGRLYGYAGSGRHALPAAFSARGRVLLTYRANVPPVVVRPDGVMIAMGPDDSTAIAYAATGRRIWKQTNIGLPKSADALVTADNTFYAAFEGHSEDGSAGLDVFSPAGRRTRIEPGTSVMAVALAPDGQLYSRIFDGGTGESWLQAIGSDGRVQWAQALGTGIEEFPAKDNLIPTDNAVYVTAGDQLRAYSPSGTLLWQMTKADRPLVLALRADGVLVTAGDKTLDAITPLGTTLWSTGIGISRTSQYAPTLVVDAAGTEWVGRQDGTVQIVSSSGATLGTLVAGGYHYGLSPTVLLASGRIVVNGTDGTLRIYGS